MTATSRFIPLSQGQQVEQASRGRLARGCCLSSHRFLVVVSLRDSEDLWPLMAVGLGPSLDQVATTTRPEDVGATPHRDEIRVVRLAGFRRRCGGLFLAVLVGALTSCTTGAATIRPTEAGPTTPAGSSTASSSPHTTDAPAPISASPDPTMTTAPTSASPPAPQSSSAAPLWVPPCATCS